MEYEEVEVRRLLFRQAELGRKNRGKVGKKDQGILDWRRSISSCERPTRKSQGGVEVGDTKATKHLA